MRIKMYSFGRSIVGSAYLYSSLVPDDATLEQELDGSVDIDLISLMDTDGLLEKVLKESYFTYVLYGVEDVLPQYVVIMREDLPYFNVDSFTETRGSDEDRRANLRKKYFVPILIDAFTSDPKKVEVIREDEQY
jgi:hypothetical protein